MIEYVSSEEKCFFACGLEENKKTKEIKLSEACLSKYQSAKQTPPELKWFKNIKTIYQYLPKTPNECEVSQKRIKEKGQSLKDFMNIEWLVPIKRSEKIIVSSINIRELQMEVSDYIIKGLELFLEAYFDRSVSRIDYPITYSKSTLNKNNQIEALRLITDLGSLKNEMCCSIIGVTLCDIFDSSIKFPHDKFVFGMANDKCKSCVISLARYLQPLNNDALDEKALLKKACLVAAHEVCHTFGLGHCVYYRCLMNEDNSVDDEQQIPMFLCPICLHKLYFLFGFDIRERYERLMSFCKNYQFQDEYNWYKKRLKTT